MESRTNTAQPERAFLPRFGEVHYAGTDVIEFPWGVPGFPDCRRWLFLTLESQPNYVWLQSLDDPGIAMPATHPRAVFEDYDPELPAAAFLALEIDRASDFTMLCVVVVGDEAREMTINLQAPVLVNLRARKALQITLPGSEYSAHEIIPRTHEGAGAMPAAKAS